MPWTVQQWSFSTTILHHPHLRMSHPWNNTKYILFILLKSNPPILPPTHIQRWDMASPALTRIPVRIPIQQCMVVIHLECWYGTQAFIIIPTRQAALHRQNIHYGLGKFRGVFATGMPTTFIASKIWKKKDVTLLHCSHMGQAGLPRRWNQRLAILGPLETK